MDKALQLSAEPDISITDFKSPQKALLLCRSQEAAGDGGNETVKKWKEHRKFLYGQGFTDVLLNGG